MHLECKAIPLAQNLLCRVWECFAEKPPGLNIKLIKRIPIGAGLGGGSADAAAFLGWLNARAQKPLGPEDLVRMAVSIGADLPFFLQDGQCRANGIGERLTAVAVNPGPYLLLVWPGINVSTAWAFAAWDELFRNGLTNMASAARNANSAGINLRNDLEMPVFARWPELGVLKEQLLVLGAEAAAMSGSGSAIYGIFSSQPAARAALDVLRQKWPCVFYLKLRDFGM